jgi:flagellar export protein FliJ
MNVKGFGALARMHRFRMDQHRRKAVEIEAMRDEFQAQEAGLDRDIAREKGALQSDQMAMTDFAAYLKRMEERRETLNASIAEASRALDRVNEHMAVEYCEAKKFELALEREEKRKKHEADKAEQAMLDEIGLTYRNRTAI